MVADEITAGENGVASIYMSMIDKRYARDVTEEIDHVRNFKSKVLLISSMHSISMCKRGMSGSINQWLFLRDRVNCLRPRTFQAYYR